MSGKIKAGTLVNPTLSNSKAYCEGRKAAFDGALVTTNPHQASSPDSVGWIAGWNTYVSGGATPMVRDACAINGLLT
jgi:hypothetical protein